MNFIKNRLFILIIVFLFYPLYVNGNVPLLDNHQKSEDIKNKMAKLSLKCIELKDSIEQEDLLEIKRILKIGKQITTQDSSEYYLYNLLNLSYLRFIKKDYKRTFKISQKLMIKHQKKDSTIIVDFLKYPPTWRGMNKWAETKLKNLSSSLIILNDSSVYGEKSLIMNILQEIPMELGLNIYNQYIQLYQHYGAKLEDIIYFILRTIENGRDDIYEKWSYIIDNNPDTIINNLVKFGLCGYAVSCRQLKITKVIIPDISKEFFEELNLKNTNFGGFVTSLYHYSLGISYKNEILPLLIKWFGADSKEVEWLKSKDSFLFSEDPIKNEDKLFLSKNLGDSLQLSKNIVKGVVDLNTAKELYEYETTWINFVLPDHKPEFWNNLGLRYRLIHEYDTAIRIFNKAINLIDNGTQPTACALIPIKKEDIMTNLAYAYGNKGEYEKALEILEKKMPMWEISNSSIDIFSKDIIHLDDIGRVYAYINPQKASTFFAKADSIINNRQISNISPFDKIWHLLSWAQVLDNDKVAKRNLVAKAEDIISKTQQGIYLFQPNNGLTGLIYLALGKYYYSICDHKQANDYFFKATPFFANLSQGNRQKCDLTLWTCLNKIALSDTVGVKSILANQLVIQDSLLSSKHYDYLQTTKALLKLAIITNDSILAQKHYNSFKNNVNLFGKEKNNYDNKLIEAAIVNILGNHKTAFEIVDNINLDSCEAFVGVKAIELKQQLAKAFPIRIYSEESVRNNYAVKKLCARLFTEISGDDRTEWPKQLEKLKSDFIVNASTDNLWENALDFSLFIKGLLLRTNKHIITLISKTKNGQNAIKELDILRDTISYYIQIGDSLNLIKSRRKYEVKERDLIAKYLNTDKMLLGLNTSKENVLTSLQSRDLAIDFVRYIENDTAKYGAFVFSLNLKPIFIPLCKETSIIKLLEKDTEISRPFYRDKEYKGYAYELIWQALLPYFKHYEQIYFSGDGLLNQLAIELLPDKNDISLNEKYRIHRVFHLADIEKPVQIGNQFIALGVSDYNSPIMNFSYRDRGSWSDLTYVKVEFDNIEAIFKSHGRKYHPKFILNDMARESLIKSLNGININTLHISTHGFYKPHEALLEALNDTLHVDHYVAKRALGANMYSLSGLILRQGNLSWKSDSITSEYDDILMSKEIESLSFPKLNLTVLSACETGLGDIDSEGVWGLQRAFRIAGTKSLICSLCKVDDYWTSQFMSVFYENACQGKTVYDSYQAAQKHLYKKTNKKRKGTKIWPSFILIE